MAKLFALNRRTIAAFGVMSGVYKVFGGEADLTLFATLGLTPGLVAVFGAVQALAGLGLLRDETRRPAAVVLALCNAFATWALFANGVQPFGAISMLFVAMAAAEARQQGGQRRSEATSVRK